jgi:hypothetical protein
VTRTGALDIDEVNVVGGGMNHGPESHRVGYLTVEPNVLICWESPSETRTNDTDDVAEHGQENKTTIVSQDETSTARGPDGERESIQSSQFLVAEL